MFKFFNLLLILGVFNKIKGRLFVVVASIILIVVSNSIFDDAIVISGESSYLALFIKWAVILALIALIIFQIKKIFRASNPSLDNKESQILSKEKLKSRSDIVAEKYRKDRKLD